MLVPVVQIRSMRMAVFHLGVGMLVGMAACNHFVCGMVVVMVLVRVKMGMDMRHRVVMMQVAVRFTEK